VFRRKLSSLRENSSNNNNTDRTVVSGVDAAETKAVPEAIGEGGAEGKDGVVDEGMEGVEVVVEVKVEIVEFSRTATVSPGTRHTNHRVTSPPILEAFSAFTWHFETAVCNNFYHVWMQVYPATSKAHGPIRCSVTHSEYSTQRIFPALQALSTVVRQAVISQRLSFACEPTSVRPDSSAMPVQQRCE
jgi:hypothetical protein